MKKFVISLITIGLIFSFAYAGTMQPSMERKPVESPAGRRLEPKRNVPTYTFTKAPTSIAVNYYDYMIGSYNGLPIRVIPPHVQGGGYFMTYHGRSQSTGTRRMYYSYLDAAGNLKINSTITNSQIHEGYGTLAVDPVSGKPFYSWHAALDGTSAPVDVLCVSDIFYEDLVGLWNEYGAIIDNPYSLSTTTDNEFIWPTAVIGPSPVQDMRRLYIIARNSVSHSVNGNPCENPLIVYADFDENTIATGADLVWNYIDIPEMTAWNHDTTAWRRPFYSLAVDQLGNLYYAGFHFANDADNNSIDEEDMDVFKCGNYGQGEWTRVSAWSTFPMVNPPAYPGADHGYFENQNNQPYADGELGFSAMASASGHCNTVTDGLDRVQTMGIWALSTNEGSYYPNMQYVKSFIFDPSDNTFEIKEIYPQKDPADTHNACFVPWDVVEPYGEAEYIEYQNDDGTIDYYLSVVTDWPYPYWDLSAHDDAMSFHYNNAKLTEDNDCGLMAAVWQNSWRARQYNEYNDADWIDYQDTPEIWISVSPDHGDTWSEPIVLDNQNVPEFQGIKPMWVYPADKVIYTRMEGKQKVGKLGFMFYNDYTWGSASIEYPVGNPDGGEVMFMELEIVFPEGGPDAPVDADDYTQTPAIKLLDQNFPNPFNPSTTISYTMNNTGDAKLAIYNVKGQLVNTLVNGTKEAGKHSVVWNGTDSKGKDVPSGIYFYRLTTGKHVETKKMMLMK